MFKVSYTIKGEDKLLSDQSATFRYMKDAFVFMRQLLHMHEAGILLIGAKLVGKPTIERL
jgi:hypothetical protein